MEEAMSGEIREEQRGRDGAAMMHVPEGPFLMGSDIGNQDEHPQREVALQTRPSAPSRVATES